MCRRNKWTQNLTTDYSVSSQLFRKNNDLESPNCLWSHKSSLVGGKSFFLLSRQPVLLIKVWDSKIMWHNHTFNITTEKMHKMPLSFFFWGVNFSNLSRSQLSCWSNMTSKNTYTSSVLCHLIEIQSVTLTAPQGGVCTRWCGVAGAPLGTT